MKRVLLFYGTEPERLEMQRLNPERVVLDPSQVEELYLELAILQVELALCPTTGGCHDHWTYSDDRVCPNCKRR